MPSTSPPPKSSITWYSCSPPPPNPQKVVEVVEAVEVMRIWLSFATNSLNGKVEVK